MFTTGTTSAFLDYLEASKTLPPGVQLRSWGGEMGNDFNFSG